MNKLFLILAVVILALAIIILAVYSLIESSRSVQTFTSNESVHAPGSIGDMHFVNATYSKDILYTWQDNMLFFRQYVYDNGSNAESLSIYLSAFKTQAAASSYYNKFINGPTSSLLFQTSNLTILRKTNNTEDIRVNAHFPNVAFNFLEYIDMELKDNYTCLVSYGYIPNAAEYNLTKTTWSPNITIVNTSLNAGLTMCEEAASAPSNG